MDGTAAGETGAGGTETEEGTNGAESEDVGAECMVASAVAVSSSSTPAVASVCMIAFSGSLITRASSMYCLFGLFSSTSPSAARFLAAFRCFEDFLHL